MTRQINGKRPESAIVAKASRVTKRSDFGGAKSPVQEV